MSRRIHIVGRKNSGKTTLLCELVHDFTTRGLKVATVKHTHHHHELDAPGKDSHKHREAGAIAVGILSPKMTALFVPIDREQCGDSRYAGFERQFADCDIILVEGDLQTSAQRIEVWRSVSGEAPYAANDSAIFAVISDDAPPGIQCAVWRRGNVKDIADKILKSLGLQSDTAHSQPREV